VNQIQEKAEVRVVSIEEVVARNYVDDHCRFLGLAGASITLGRLVDEIETPLTAPAEIAIRVF